MRSAPADSVYLLSGVDEQEKQCKGSSHRRGDLKWERIDMLQKLVQGAGQLFLPATPATPDTQILDCFEYFFSFKVFDHSSKCAGEPAYVFMKRGVLISRSFHLEESVP